jgi:cytochrome c heme-lyase
MKSIIAVHNNMNERSWMALMEWEKMHCKECENPKLLRFTGKPDDLTPKAWLKHHLFGYPKPFDRHDWTIDRCGKQVRYVIDYYYDEERGKQDDLPTLRDMHSVKSITFDVRPAIDTPEALYDRMRMASQTWFPASVDTAGNAQETKEAGKQ